MIFPTSPWSHLVWYCSVVLCVSWPATWLHFVHEIAVSIFWSFQCSWWDLVLAKTRPAQRVTLYDIFSNQGDVVYWLFMYRSMHGVSRLGMMVCESYEALVSSCSILSSSSCTHWMSSCAHIPSHTWHPFPWKLSHSAHEVAFDVI